MNIGNDQVQQPTPQHRRAKESPQDDANVSYVRRKSTESRSDVRQRKIDQLDAGPADQTSHKKENGPGLAKISDISRQHESEKNQAIASRPIEKARETRSKATKRPLEDTEHRPISIDVEPRHKGTPWKRPLIYPQNGKSRANVTWDDLERLNDDEFLNDNLVALFMRYLQEHMDQEHAKTMHFFSTFFYNALTRPAEKSKSRQINYPAVANWTKTVNLFKRDYVIVPVNEAAHWYVMIICNLRYFQEPRNKDEDVVEIAAPVEDDKQNKDPLKVIVESDVVVDKDISDGSDYTGQLKNPAPTPARKRPGRPKLQQRQRKYRLDEPIIITLDSLDQARSSTATALKSYLVEEAKDKYDLTIDKNDIRGMTAKAIPLQANFSDCGLYLCMYLEQFVRDPAMFIKSILQRDEKSFAWPKNLQTGALRDRFYDMIDRLQRAQTKKVVAELPPIGRLLIKDEDYLEDQRTKKKTPRLEMYEPANIKAGIDFYNSHQSKDEEQPFPPAAEAPIHDQRLRASGITETHGSTSQPIVVEDSQDNHTQDDTSSRFFQQGKGEGESSRTGQQPDTPMALAEHLRRVRSPAKPNYEAQIVPSTPIDLTTSVTAKQDPVNDDSHTEEAEQRNLRGISCSTDHLTGTTTYEDKNGDERHQRSDGSITYTYGPDHAMKDAEDEFNGFVDEIARSRDTSIVPESIQGSQSDEMLLDH